MPLRILLRLQALLQVLSTGVLAALLLIATPAQAAESDAAQKLWMGGKRAEAVAMLEESLRKTPNDLELRFALGVMRMELGELSTAATLFTQLSQDFPDLADPLNNLAVIHAAQGQLDLAQAELTQALALQPAHAQALENLGDVLLRQAERAYQRALKAQVAPQASTQAKLKQTQGLLHQLDAAKAP